MWAVSRLKISHLYASITNLAVDLKNLALRDARYKDFRGIDMVLDGLGESASIEFLNNLSLEKLYKSMNYINNFLQTKKNMELIFRWRCTWCIM